MECPASFNDVDEDSNCGGSDDCNELMMMTARFNDRVTGTTHFFSLDLTSMTDNQRWIGEPYIALKHRNKHMPQWC